MGHKTLLIFNFLRFLLIYENMCWKALQRLVLSAEQNTKTMQATTQTTLLLIWWTFLAIIEKKSKRRLKKEILIFVKNTLLTKNWFVPGKFCEFCKHHMEKCRSCHLYFLVKTKIKFTTFKSFYLQSKY